MHEVDGLALNELRCPKNDCVRNTDRRRSPMHVVSPEDGVQDIGSQWQIRIIGIVVREGQLVGIAL